MITIKELSEDIGVSKVGINKWIERNGYRKQLQKVGNKFMIPSEVEQAIRANFDRTEPKPKKIDTVTDKKEDSVTSEILALLREQLHLKDAEIERLHKQVDDLQRINADLVKALRENHTLHAMQLSTETTPKEIPENTQGDHQEVRRRTFFDFFRGSSRK